MYKSALRRVTSCVAEHNERTAISGRHMRVFNPHASREKSGSQGSLRRTRSCQVGMIEPESPGLRSESACVSARPGIRAPQATGYEREGYPRKGLPLAKR